MKKYIGQEGVKEIAKLVKSELNKKQDILNEIGGVNLLKNSDFHDGTTGYSAYRGSAAIDTIDGLTVCKYTSNDDALSAHYLQYQLPTTFNLSVGDIFTFSINVKTDEPIDIHTSIEGMTNNRSYEIVVKTESQLNGWKRIICTGEYTRSEFHRLRITVHFSIKSDTNKSFYIYHPKLERGSIASDWSLSPEDIQNVIEEEVSKKQDTISYATVTLFASGWGSDNTQMVSVTGVKTDERTQMITPMPAAESRMDYYEAGILCTAQSDNKLTFTARSVPTSDITVYVAITPFE